MENKYADKKLIKKKIHNLQVLPCPGIKLDGPTPALSCSIFKLLNEAQVITQNMLNHFLEKILSI